MKRVLAPLILGALLPLAVGCAATSEDDTAETNDAISHEQAAAKLNVSELLVRDVPASPSGAGGIGVKEWSVYGSAVDNAAGMVAFGTDSKGDVKYAIAIDGTSKHLGVVEYDKNGPVGAPVDPRTANAFGSDLALIRTALERAAEDANPLAPVKCLFSVALLAVGAAVTATGPGAIAAVAYFGSVAGVGAVQSLLAYVFGTLGMGLFIPMEVTIFGLKIVSEAWGHTVGACSATLRRLEN